MNKKVNFVWEIPFAGWKWEATHYQGNAVFFGKVTSPFVPHGEFGTWYYNDLKSEGAVLIKGSQTELNSLLNTAQTRKAMDFQRAMRDVGF